MSFFFSPYKCLVYVAFGNENYARIAGRLQSKGIPYRTKSDNLGYNPSQLFPRIENTQYEIYVKPEDEHRALQAIHES